MTKDFYSTKEVAELTGLTVNAIRQYIYRGQLKAEKFNGVNLITKEALEDWERTRKPRKQKDGVKND